MPVLNRKKANLEFVNVGHPDEIKNRQNKRKIHQHVMKDIGFSRRKNAQEKIMKSDLSISKSLTIQETRSRYTSHQPDRLDKTSESSMQPLVPGADRTLYSRTDARAKMMEAFLLRPKSSICDRVREICFAIGLVDDAPLNLALAETALYRNNQVGFMHSEREDLTALKHYNRCLQFTSQKIQSSNTMKCDDVLITVIDEHSSYFLLSVPRLDSSDGPEMYPSGPSLIHEALRLAALRFLVTAAEHIHYTFGAVKHRKPQLSRLLMEYEIPWDGLEELQVWVLVIAAVTEKTHDKVCLTKAITLTMKRLGLDRIGLKELLEQISWVDSFEDEFEFDSDMMGLAKDSDNMLQRGDCLQRNQSQKTECGTFAHKQLTPQRMADDIKAKDLHNTFQALYKISLENDKNRTFGLPGYNASMFLFSHSRTSSPKLERLS
ncbi:hypothetical protein FBEOM_8424 [Fusarium beomiforme]|uniref:Uncharacterized protein n=1 Tax=Fusarium beomiforme TaxID=44412 RepID=A0A9P5AF75_9HYPO|nr:hypothetical protein FBEOM_8424 [Fusarium beomiforme]